MTKKRMSSLDFIGWAGTTCFAICPIPQIMKCAAQGHAKGVSEAFLWVWLIGEVLMFHYLTKNMGRRAPLKFNFYFNIVCIGVILYYVYFPSR